MHCTCISSTRQVFRRVPFCLNDFKRERSTVARLANYRVDRTLHNASKAPRMAHAKWGYTEENGPSTWVKNLSIEIGHKQSPINIVNSQCAFDPSLNNLKFSYPVFETATLLNNGHTVMFRPNDADNISHVSHGPVSNKYKLAQFHFHWGKDDSFGSEHTVDGGHFPCELHFVHWNTELFSSAKEALTSPNGLLVFGIFLKVGDQEHPALSKITSNLPLIKTAGSKTILQEPFNPSSLLPDSLEYWSYTGSLTTPPLSESVTWIVFKNPINISCAQVAAFRELYSDDGGKVCQNCRPTCPLNNRQVKASFQ